MTKGRYLTSIQLIAKERKRQINKEHFDIDNDIMFNDLGELAQAASAYAYPIWEKDNSIPKQFPDSWDDKWWKPTPDDRIRELVKAGALIAAEIDRLQKLKEEGRTIRPMNIRPPDLN